MASTTPATNAPRPVLFISIPRTASNLLTRILNADGQPNVHTSEFLSGYQFLPAHRFRVMSELIDRPSAKYSAEDAEVLQEITAECFEDFERFRREAAAEGKVAFSKEHIMIIVPPSTIDRYLPDATEPEDGKAPLAKPVDSLGTGARSDLNCTFFSDEYLAMWRPVFLIRHPAKTFPSVMRTSKDANMEGNHAIYASFSLIRNLVELYSQLLNPDGSIKAGDAPYTNGHAQQAGEAAAFPIVVDADDLVEQPRVVEKVARAIDFDVDALQFSWDTDEEERKKTVEDYPLITTLMNSKAPEADKSSRNLSIDDEVPKWIAEFGEERGRQLEQRVRAAMPDFLYLKSKRLMP